MTANELEINTGYYFPTPVWHVNILKEMENNNISMKEIIKECKKIKVENKGRKVSNFGKNAYQSNDLEFNSSVSSIFRVGQIISTVVKTIYNSVWKGNIELTNSWLNINKKNSQNIMHIHPTSILSGCFYIKVPKNSGDLTIVRNSFDQFIYQDYGNTHKNEKGEQILTSFTADMFSFIPKVGDIYIFPSHIQHQVSINETNKSRISIAFNTTRTDK
jgi:uncharacterized protein (TIGR02466 family)